MTDNYKPILTVLKEAFENASENTPNQKIMLSDLRNVSLTAAVVLTAIAHSFAHNQEITMALIAGAVGAFSLNHSIKLKRELTRLP